VSIQLLQRRGDACEPPGELNDQRTNEVSVILFRGVLEIEIEVRERERRVESAFTLDGFDDGRATNMYC